MIDLSNPNPSDFKHIEASKREAAHKQPLHSHIKAKTGGFVIPRTKHKITKLPQGIL